MSSDDSTKRETGSGVHRANIQASKVRSFFLLLVLFGICACGPGVIGRFCAVL